MCVSKARTWVSALWLLLLLRLLFPPPPPGASASHCTLPSPMNVHFVSKNMKNVLHWLPPEGIAEEKVNYTVKYLIYGTNKWIKNSECRNISQTWCDLSHETYDHKELYHARVKAFLNGNCSDWAESARFNPFTDIIVTPPKKWRRGPGEEPEYLHQIYPSLQYNVTVFNKKIKKRWTFCIKNNSLEVQQLEPNTGYCVTVQIYITPLLLSGFSEERCIDTLKDPTFKQTTIIFGYILPVFLTVLIILVPSCCIYRYIHKAKQTYPKNLVLKPSNQFGGDVFVPSEKIIVNFITVTIVDEYKNEYKNSPENTHFLDHASNSDGNNVEETFSKELEEKHSPDSCLIEGSENEQDGNRPSMTTLGSQCTPGQRHNDEVVVYEFDMRAEDGIPTENTQEEFHTKENISALEELLHNSPKALSLIPEKGPSYYLPYNVRAPNIFLVQNLSELYLNEMDPIPDNLCDDLQPPLINLMTEKLDQAFCPECGMVTDICLVHDQKEPFLDSVGCFPKEPQTFRNMMTRYTASPYCPQFVTWASKDQQAAKEVEEQSLIVAWGPQTGRLYLPSLSNFRNEIHEQIIENKKYEDSLGKGLFSRLYERPYSDEPLEEKKEVYLQQLKEQWGLHIQTQA
ncbi:interleukin-20 receptor subunit alpha-like isoform X2 [Eublepharis macularius]|uniref:Interleukin-20 receptor subunit alpha-like isoform X2 n=1 Tax=Eublepharis macularius TaxID=481883 RepID=A0AA97K917_EUBMA|nr:interleukin-20 receptor subunit alpha-like isoform X2 [Eublepharis macularius]